LAAVAAIALYFFVLPLAIMPMMQRVYVPVTTSKISESEWAKAAGLNDPPVRSPRTNDFRTQLLIWHQDATDNGEAFTDVNAGELHKRVGYYPGPSHRMPLCCQVMRDDMQDGDLILEEPPKGAGASLTIRYQLPRKNADTVLESVKNV
jgi:5-methylcytosine-specific restriction protein A